MAAAGAAATAGDEAAGAGKGSPAQVPRAGGAAMLGAACPERRCGARRGVGGSALRRRSLLSGCGAGSAAALPRSQPAPEGPAGAGSGWGSAGPARAPLPALGSASGSGHGGAAVHRAAGSRSLVEPS